MQHFHVVFVTGITFLFIIRFDVPAVPSDFSVSLSVNRASRRIHPGDRRRSWPWGSCCGCHQPLRPRSGCSGPDSSSCLRPRCPWLLNRTKGEWGNAHRQRSPGPPWRTGRSRSPCRNTGKSWTGSSASGC